jgi:SAM-dependent methyltransferase
VEQEHQAPPTDAELEARGVQGGMLWFHCNVCGRHNFVELDTLDRETKSCGSCRSSARWRAVVDVLARELFGESVPLPDFPIRRDLHGIGLSDWPGYSGPLAERFDYVNTFYDEEPQLDIAEINPSLEGTLDFLIASDVFEHVAPPVSRAFTNARRLLKPGGVLVLTVPWRNHLQTIEHYPELHDFEIIERAGRPVLRNVRSDGVVEEHDDLCFHGGPGAVLEMRLFGKDDLIAELHAAGFETVSVYDRPNFAIGVYWPIRDSLPLAARC